MSNEIYDQPYSSYKQMGQYQIPVPEDHIWKREYIKIDFNNKSFEYLRTKLEKLKIPEEKVQDLIDELDIIVNNAGKMNIEKPEINWLLDEFETLWENYCIYTLENSRYINELNHVRRYAMYILLQEYHKSISGWQGDNLLRQKIEQGQTYNIRQEQVESRPKRGIFKSRRKPILTSNNPATQGFNMGTMR